MIRMLAVNNGTVLELDGTELREVLHGPGQARGVAESYWATDVTKLRDGQEVRLHRVADPRGEFIGTCCFAERRIGCCQFSKADWALIMEARRRPATVDRQKLREFLELAEHNLAEALALLPSGCDYYSYVSSVLTDLRNAVEVLVGGNVNEFGGVS